MNEKQTETYITQHLKESEQLVQFSVNCPEPECQDTLDSLRKHNLKTILFTHISKKHPENKDNYSKKSLAPYVENNYKKELVSAKKQLSDIHFTIICSFCPREPEFRNQVRHGLISSFKKHLKKHPDITEEQTKIYIEKHLKKPKQPVEFSIRCPECGHTVYNCKRDELNRNLSRHISKTHPQNKDNYPKQLIAKHVKENLEQTPVPAKKKLKNTKKRKIPKSSNLSISSSSTPRQSLLQLYTVCPHSGQRIENSTGCFGFFKCFSI